MTQKEIDIVKSITIDQVKKFYPTIVEEDFYLMQSIIEDLDFESFQNLYECLAYVLQSLADLRTEEYSAMQSMVRDMRIDDIIGDI